MYHCFVILYCSALKRQRKTRKKLLERVQSQKETHREVSELISDKSKTFSLKSITSRKQLDELDGGVVYSDNEEEILEPELPVDPLLPSNIESEDEIIEGNDGEEEPLEWESDVGASSSDDDEKEDTAEEGIHVACLLLLLLLLLFCVDNPLVVKLEKKNKSKQVKNWFNNSAFKGLIADEDEDIELMTALNDYKKKGKKDKKR